MEVVTRFLFAFNKTSWERPQPSNVPGCVDSTKASALAINLRNVSLSFSELSRSRTMDRLFRFAFIKVRLFSGSGTFPEKGPSILALSPPGFSILITSAPKSPSHLVAYEDGISPYSSILRWLKAPSF